MELQYSRSLNRNKLKFLREGLKLSQEYVAAKLNISQQAYSRMEKNFNNITIGRLIKLSDILGISPNILIGEDEIHFHQKINSQGEKMNSSIQVTGISEAERNAYLEHIADLKAQIDTLKNLLTENKQVY